MSEKLSDSLSGYFLFIYLFTYSTCDTKSDKKRILFLKIADIYLVLFSCSLVITLLVPFFIIVRDYG